MQVSIIIPVYNIAERDIRRCIDNILEQTFSDYEIIIVDDGSVQKCADILDSLSLLDTRIRVIHKKNEGVSVARNYGVEISQGQYILFVDGDDLLTPWVLQSGIDLLKGTEADVVIGRIFQTNILPKSYPSPTPKNTYEIIDTKEDRECFQAHILSKNKRNWGRNNNGWMFNCEGCWAHLMKKDIAKKFKFIPGIAVAEDTIWAVQMMESEEQVKICLVDELWYYYIQNENSVMNKYNANIREQLTSPICILNTIFLKKNNYLYNAYLDWTLIKMKQIVYRFYLSDNCEMSFVQKMKSMNELIKELPWKDVMKGKKTLSLGKKIKLFMYRRNLMLPLFCIKKFLTNF